MAPHPPNNKDIKSDGPMQTFTRRLQETTLIRK